MKLSILVFFFLFSLTALCQQDSVRLIPLTSADTGIKKRTTLVTAVNIVGYGGSLFALNSTWYNGYPRSSFHTFNDSGEWLQVDKVGHAWSSYNIARASTALWQWAGMSKKKAVLIGGISGTGYLTVVELLDGFSSKWGWSWADMGANIFGSGLYVVQDLGWNEQRIQFKFSFHHYNYRDVQLKDRAASLFGSAWYEKMLKDYNAQTYWMSANLKSFLPLSNLPAWLNVAVGYGADGMYGGYKNEWNDGSGVSNTRYDVPRRRQWFIAPDVDFTKIKTNSKFLRTSFFILNAFKFPAPALELSAGKFKVKAVSF